jgi:Protein of unknown function (DUF4244)
MQTPLAHAGGRCQIRRPQDGVSSTDRGFFSHAAGEPAWLFAMSLFNRITRRAKAIRAAADAGMTTAEYAVGTVAAVAFAAVLYKVVRSATVQSALTSIIQSALHSL